MVVPSATVRCTKHKTHVFQLFSQQVRFSDLGQLHISDTHTYIHTYIHVELIALRRMPIRVVIHFIQHVLLFCAKEIQFLYLKSGPQRYNLAVVFLAQDFGLELKHLGSAFLDAHRPGKVKKQDATIKQGIIPLCSIYHAAVFAHASPQTQTSLAPHAHSEKQRPI